MITNWNVYDYHRILDSLRPSSDFSGVLQQAYAEEIRASNENATVINVEAKPEEIVSLLQAKAEAGNADS